MTRLLTILFLGLALSVSGAVKYASPAGGGDGSSTLTPTTMQGGLALLSAGDTLRLMDGTFTGASGMLVPAVNLSGTSIAPITVEAINDGAVTIDGQGVRTTVFCRGNDWWIFRGFNVKSSSATVFDIGLCQHCLVQRIIAWDAPLSANEDVFWAGGSGIGSHAGFNTLEDCMGFGTGRKIFSSSQGGNNTTYRRCLAIWQGSTCIGPKMGFSGYYNSTGNLLENCISMIDATRQGITPIDQPYAPFSRDNNSSLVGPPFDGPYLLGCINYMGTTQAVSTFNSGGYYFPNEVDQTGYLLDCLSFVQSVAVPPFTIGLYKNTNITAIGVSASTWGSGGHANRLEVSNPANFSSTLFAATALAAPASGAHIYYRYQNGGLTGTPLWPWPMNDRIKNLIGMDVTLLMTGSSPAPPTPTTTTLTAARISLGRVTINTP